MTNNSLWSTDPEPNAEQARKKTMKEHSKNAIHVVLLIATTFCLLLTHAANAAKPQQSPPPLAQEDAALSAETYHLWQSLGDKLWPGWTAVPEPLIYVTSDFEYTIDFPKPLREFTPLAASPWLNKPIQA